MQHGISQLGPGARAVAARLEEEERTPTREMARAHKALQRARERKREEERRGLASKPLHNDMVDRILVRELKWISLQIVRYIVGELRSFPGPSSRRDVIERVMRHNIFWPFLPVYHPRPQEAKVIHGFIEDFKKELQLVKVAN